MPPPDRLEPLPYHREILAHLRGAQDELWNWFSSNPVREEHVAQLRLDLLKTTYRIEPATAPRLHEASQRAAAALGIDVPITFYQSQRSIGLNAAFVHLSGEAHIVLTGPVLDVFTDRELESLIGHELSHRILWTGGQGEYHVADQILGAMTNDALPDPAQCESARLFRLYTEIFCDRGGLLACGDLLSSVGALVKTETGMKEINGESYLRQAEEIFNRAPAKTDGQTHPECFIRARALRLWSEQGSDAEAEIRRMIQGPRLLVGLDLLGQTQVAKLTRRLIDRFLSPAWMQTEITRGHARLFFKDFGAPAPAVPDDELAAELNASDDKLRDYFCYVLLDFVTTDRDLETTPLAAALLLTKRLGLGDRFEPIARNELALRKKQFDKLRSDAEKIVAAAEQTGKVS